MKKRKVILIISILLLVTLVCSYPFFIDKLKIQWKNLVAPRPELQEFDEPEFLVEVPGLVYEFSWLEGSSSIRLSSSHWSCSTPDAPDTISYYDFSSEEVTFTTEEVLEDQEDSENFPEIFELDDSADDWVTCENKGIAVATGDFSGEEYWLKYWLDGDLVETFYFGKNTPWLATRVPCVSKTRPEGAKFRNTPSACCGDRKFEGFANLFFRLNNGKTAR